MADFDGENAVKRSRIYVRKENKEKISDCNEETGKRNVVKVFFFSLQTAKYPVKTS